MASATSLALHFPTLTQNSRAEKFLQNDLPRTSVNFPNTHKRTHHHLHHHHHHVNHNTTCKASSSSSSLPSPPSYITEYDLYDLMGIESGSDQSQIKKAYRSLQKRCHPDIAGPAGHDMAIILNDAYAVLSDPVARFAYDKEQAKMTELQGYTGQPMYSSWLGSEMEQRAVFVDEAKCVGCLKCALFANKTFAIESAYGRARVVAQWADPEDKIQSSIDVCPVSCISVVERSDLAALEFLMSKQPRGNVRIGASNTAGARSFDVFSEVKVFQKRLDEAATRKSQRESKYSKFQADARMSAIQAIRSISNWIYWQSPAASQAASNLAFTDAERSPQPDLEKLRDAATAARIQGLLKTIDTRRLLPQPALKDEYWTPNTLAQVKHKNASSTDTITSGQSSANGHNINGRTYIKREKRHRRPLVTLFPFGMAVLAAINVKLLGAGGSIGGLEEHMGGSFALEVVNSSWLQVILAGVPWYLFGIVVERLIEGLSNRNEV